MADGIEFFKMSATGNDFIVGDNRAGQWEGSPLERLAQDLCRPHTGVGADGLILIEHSKKAHLKLRIFNSNGSGSPMCGNGARCAARYAFLKVIAGRSMTMEVGPQVLNAEILADNRVKVEVPGQADPPRRLDVALKGRVLTGYLTSTGVPHFVLFVRDEEALAALPLEAIGPVLRRAPELGPDGANINFLSLSPCGPYSIRTFERGVEAETLSCGTGVTAAAWVLRTLGKVGRSVRLLPRSGSELEVEIQEGQDPSPLFMLTGDAKVIYRATLSGEATPQSPGGAPP